MPRPVHFEIPADNPQRANIRRQLLRHFRTGLLYLGSSDFNRRHCSHGSAGPSRAPQRSPSEEITEEVSRNSSCGPRGAAAIIRLQA